MNEEIKTRLKAGTLLALIIIGLLLVVVVVHKLSTLVFLILIAAITTAGIDQPTRWLQAELHFPRALAIVVVMLLAAVIVLGIVALLAYTAVTQGIQFAEHAWPHLQADLLRFGDHLHQRFPFIPNPEGLWEKFRAQSGQVAGYVWSTTRAVFGVLGSVVSIATVLLLTFFFSNSLDDLTRTFAQFIPPPHRERVLHVSHLVGQKMGGWMRGQLTLAGMIAALSLVGMLALGVPYALLIAAMGGLGEFIPMVGPYTAFIPALIIVLVTGAPLWKIIAVIVFFIALIEVEGYVLGPRVMQRAVELAR